MSVLKKIASFFWDIPIVKTASDMNPYLEVVWSQGKKMLNTRNANFSFGNGHAVFKVALSHVPQEIAEAQHILILGFGCGSIVDLLEKEHTYQGKITGIEYDSKIIELYHDHFASDYSLQPTLLAADAFQYTSALDTTFDLICIDLFQELENVESVFSKSFLKAIAKNGKCLIFNLTNQNTTDGERITELVMYLSTFYRSVERIPCQEINELIIAKSVILADFD